MADGRRVPIEQLAPGDMVLSLVVPGLKADAPKAQYEWVSTQGMHDAVARPARVSAVRLGEHDGFHLVNDRIKATFEHPFLVRRDKRWGFCSAELLRVGDVLITHDGSALAEQPIDRIERIDTPGAA